MVILEKGNVMNKSKIPKPNKLTAAIIFLYLSYCTNLLNDCIDFLSTLMDLNLYAITSIIIVIILDLTCLVWLTYLICKGKAWIRIFLLFYIIVCLPSPVYYLFIDILFDPIASLHQAVQLIFLIIGFFLLFSKESSNWFDEVKLVKAKTKKVEWNFKLSSICFYISYSIACINLIRFYFGDDLLSNPDRYLSFRHISFIIEAIIIVTTFNLLFIQTIRKGSKIAGVLYLLYIIVTTSFKQYFAASRYIDYPYTSTFVIWTSIQVIAFTILFHKDIIRLLYKLPHKA